MSAIHSNRVKKKEIKWWLVLMAAHGIEMGFILKILSNPGARFLQNPFEHSFSLTKPS
jgi:hypothetical protein